MYKSFHQKSAAITVASSPWNGYKSFQDFKKLRISADDEVVGAPHIFNISKV